LNPRRIVVTGSDFVLSWIWLGVSPASWRRDVRLVHEMFECRPIKAVHMGAGGIQPSFRGGIREWIPLQGGPLWFAGR